MKCGGSKKPKAYKKGGLVTKPGMSGKKCSKCGKAKCAC